MNKPEKIAIAGAGISGLCVAYWLQQKGHEVTVYEQSGHIGGSIITEYPEDYVVDLGPNSALETSDVVRKLVEEIGLADQRVYGNEESNKRYILKDGQLMPVPMSPGAFIKTGLFSTRAKLNLLREPFIKPTPGDDPSLAAFVVHRLGQEFLDYAINPFVAGVYAGDPEMLSAPAGFPKLYALEKKYGSLIVGAIRGARERKKRGEVAKDRARLFSFRNGMHTLPQTMADRIGLRHIALNTRIDRCIPSEDGVELTISENGVQDRKKYDKIVFAVPAGALAEMLKDIEPALSEALTDVYYPPVAVVFSAYRSEAVSRPLDGFGFLIPQKEHRKILGSIWSSTIFPNRAPDGMAAFTTFVGGTRQPDHAHKEEASILDSVHSELQEIIGLLSVPSFTMVKTWPKAIPQYAVGYRAIQKRFEALEEKHEGLFIAGNIRRGISVGDSVLCAHETVQKIVSSQE